MDGSVAYEAGKVVVSGMIFTVIVALVIGVLCGLGISSYYHQRKSDGRAATASSNCIDRCGNKRSVVQNGKCYCTTMEEAP